MKTYVITLSRKFPKGHSRAGEPNFFKEKFMFGQQCQFCSPKGRDTNYPECYECLKHSEPIKLHTIRANYDLWAKRFAEVERGEACISVREWTDKPYRSPQIEITQLTREHGIGIQQLKWSKEKGWLVNGCKSKVYNTTLAENDGLTLDDWLDWFKNYDHTKPMAIIHFTKFRY